MLDIWRQYYESLARSHGSLLARDKNLKYLVEREIKLNCASQGPLHICQSARFRESTHQSLIWTFRLMHQTPSARQPTTSILPDAPTHSSGPPSVSYYPCARPMRWAGAICHARVRPRRHRETLGRCVKNGWGVLQLGCHRREVIVPTSEGPSGT